MIPTPRSDSERHRAMLTIDDIREGLSRPGKTQKGLAAALGLDNSQVSRLLAGKRNLRANEIPIILQTIRQLEQRLGIYST